MKKTRLCQQGDLHLPSNASILTNHVKVLPQNCLVQASQSVYMKKCFVTPRVTLSRKQGDPTLRVTLYYPRQVWNLPRNLSRFELKWIQNWLSQGSSRGRVTLPPGTTSIQPRKNVRTYSIAKQIVSKDRQLI